MKHKKEIYEKMRRKDFGESMSDETKLKVLNFVDRKLRLYNVSGTFAKISDVLTDKQKNRAFLYYLNHKEHIENIMSETNKAYEPSQSEDKNDPRIWKAEYWKWFLANCH